MYVSPISVLLTTYLKGGHLYPEHSVYNVMWNFYLTLNTEYSLSLCLVVVVLGSGGVSLVVVGGDGDDVGGGAGLVVIIVAGGIGLVFEVVSDGGAD